VIAATNKDLPAEIRAGRFREDLYFRLNVIPIFVPPLRDRGDDIRLLAEHFIAQLSREYGRRQKTIDPAAMATLRRYLWPGNVRELRNVLERLMIMVAGDVITDRHLSLPGTSVTAETPWFAGDDQAPVPLHEARERFEREYIVRVLEAQHGNMSRTAEVLGVERSNLYRKMKGYGLLPSRRHDDEEGGRGDGTPEER
jgi:two-component system nitrogen regulation response regulator NtrX